MSAWQDVSVGDLCESVSLTYNGTHRMVVLINTSDVLEGRVLNHKPVPNEHLKGQFKKTFRRNDILYSEIRPVNRRYAFIDFDDTDCYIASTKLMVIRPNTALVLPRFLYAILTSKTIVEELQLLAETRSGTFPQITFGSEVSTQRINLPSLVEQERIVDILDSIENKIRVNNAINDNLEQQAQAIFRSWFTDFIPFGGNAPSGWVRTTLGNICSCELGGTPSRAKPEYWNGCIPWINSGEVNKLRITKPSETITELGLSKSATKLLPAKTTVIAITGATLGQVSLLEIESCANQSVVGVVPNPKLPYEFIYPFITANIQELISHQTGGAQQHINKQNVESLPIIVPSRDVLKEYVGLVSGLYALIANNFFENEHLSAIRDSVLPRLMSGELDVSDLDL